MSRFGKDDIKLGHEIVEIPFIWVPDDCDEPRPGYPWFEAGRMTLSAEQLAAWPPSSRLSRRDAAGGGSGVTSADRPTAELGVMAYHEGVAAWQPVGEERSCIVPSSPRAYGDSAAVALRAAIQALEALSDSGQGSAVLDAASQRSAAARFAASDRFGGVGQVHTAP